MTRIETLIDNITLDGSTAGVEQDKRGILRASAALARLADDLTIILQCVGCALYIRSSGAVPVSCFLLFALSSVFSSTSVISVSSVGHRYLFFLSS